MDNMATASRSYAAAVSSRTSANAPSVLGESRKDTRTEVTRRNASDAGKAVVMCTWRLGHLSKAQIFELLRKYLRSASEQVRGVGVAVQRDGMRRVEVSVACDGESGEFAMKRLRALVRNHGAHMRPHIPWAKRVVVHGNRVPRESEESSMLLVSMNIRSLRKYVHEVALLSRELHPAVLLLQETHRKTDEAALYLEGMASVHQGQDESCSGLCISVRRCYNLHALERDSNNTALLATVNAHGQQIIFGSVHVNPARKSLALDQLAQALQAAVAHGQPVIVGVTSTCPLKHC